MSGQNIKLFFIIINWIAVLKLKVNYTITKLLTFRENLLYKSKTISNDSTILHHPPSHHHMTPLMGGKEFLSPETLGASRVGAHHQAGLLMFDHLGQNAELSCAPASWAANRNASQLVHQLDMSLQVP